MLNWHFILYWNFYHREIINQLVNLTFNSWVSFKYLFKLFRELSSKEYEKHE